MDVAARKGELNLARLLLKHGALVNKKTQRGWTPLEYAARGNHYAMVALLLSHNADINARDGAGLTAWQRATSANVRALLIEHGAVSGRRTGRPENEQACRTVVRLANRGDLIRATAPDTSPMGPLAPSDEWDDYYYAEMPRLALHLYGRSYILGVYNTGTPKYLSTVGADGVEQIVCQFGSASATGTGANIKLLTPFERLKLYAGGHFIRLSQEAAKWPGLGGAKALVNALRHHEDPAAFKKDAGATILNDAIAANRIDLLSYYLQHGIGLHSIQGKSLPFSTDPYAPQDYAPVYLAASMRRKTALKFLLQHGANPESRERTESPRTALAWAVRVGAVSTTRILLSYGADPNVVLPDWILSNAVNDAVTAAAQNGPSSHRVARAIHLVLTHGADPKPWIYYMLTTVAQGKGLNKILGHMYGFPLETKSACVTEALSAPGKAYPRLAKLLREAIAVRDSAFCPPEASRKALDLCLPHALKRADRMMTNAYESRLKALPGSVSAIRAQQLRWLRTRDSKCGLQELAGINKQGWYAYVLSNHERATCTVRETLKRSIALSKE